VNSAQATTDEAIAELERARLKYKSEIDGMNTTVANMAAELQTPRGASARWPCLLDAGYSLA
jgi:hypothetical protein